MRTITHLAPLFEKTSVVGMKPLSERDENNNSVTSFLLSRAIVGMKPLSERDENSCKLQMILCFQFIVGMKPLSERDENLFWINAHSYFFE